MGAVGGEGGGGLRNDESSPQASWKSAVQHHGSCYSKQNRHHGKSVAYLGGGGLAGGGLGGVGGEGGGFGGCGLGGGGGGGGGGGAGGGGLYVHHAVGNKASAGSDVIARQNFLTL